MSTSTGRKITNREITSCVRAREDFRANSSSGHNVSRAPSTGYLPEEWRKILREDETVGLRYVVLSYSTPVAWVRQDGTAVVPAVKYSVTTSKAQGSIRAGLRDVPCVESLPAS